MQRKSYDRYSRVMSTLALIVALAALCVGGAIAGGAFVTSKQIKNGAIRAADLHTNAVGSKAISTSAVSASEIKDDAVGAADIGAGQVDSEAIGTGQVTSTEIGNGEVTPQDVTMPDPVQIREDEMASAVVGADFEKLAEVGSYQKVDGSSALEVSWTGTAQAPVVSCVFQLRVDGQASAPGAGAVFVQLGSTVTVGATALFPGLGAGAHTLEVWARTPNPGFTDPCVVGPAAAGIPQTFVVGERIL